MKVSDEKNATANGLWACYYMDKYENQNPITKNLFDNYEKIITQVDAVSIEKMRLFSLNIWYRS